MKKRLVARVAAAVMSIGVGLGFTQIADADSLSVTASPPVTWSSTRYGGSPVSYSPVGYSNGAGLRGDGSSLSALAAKLGEKEETVSDALVAVREKERSAGTPIDFTASASFPNSRGARQAAVARALAAELGIDVNKVSMSLTELQVERKAGEASASSMVNPSL